MATPQHILVIGAGKSATSLIHYLLDHSQANNWFVVVGDLDVALAKEKVNNHANGRAIPFDVFNETQRCEAIKNADLVASLLPASLHYLVAETCLQFGKHLVTPSYISAKEKDLATAFEAAGLLLMGEIGLDPGIDHMSMMELLHKIDAAGGELEAVRSYTGALIAPESDTNPWHYKFSWAPMNVILAGQGTAQYLKDGKNKYIPYRRLFTDTETYNIPNTGTFEAYANRDSLNYLEKYRIPELPTFIRGTFRYLGYCEAWNCLIRLGLTDNSFTINQTTKLSYADWVFAFLPKKYTRHQAPLDQQVAEFLGYSVESEVMEQLRWLGIFSDETLALASATPAQILCELLERKWVLQSNDKDMVVMLHQIDYNIDGKKYKHTASLVMKGNNSEDTALAQSVGLPMAIFCKLLLQGKIELTGVHIPTMPEVYTPILQELDKDFGISFTENTVEV